MADAKLTLQQRAVVDNRGGTLLVSAAAGSGKTKVLVDRVMGMLQNEGRNLNEFLIITFTNAAAAELKGKIAAALSAALAKDPGNRHLSRQRSLLYLAQISTVHAFCGNLLRQYGYLLNVSPDFKMLEDAQREELLDRLLRDLLEQRYAKLTPEFQLLSDTLGAGRNDAGLEDLIKALFQQLLSQPYPEAWLSRLEFQLPVDCDLSETRWGRRLIDHARQQLSALLTRYDWAIDTMACSEKMLQKYQPVFLADKAAFAKIYETLDGSWTAIAASLCYDFPTLGRVPKDESPWQSAIKAVRDDGKKLLKELKRHFARSPETLIAEQNAMAPALKCLSGLVLELYQQFSTQKRKKNLMDFSDLEHLAILLLVDSSGQPTETAKEVSQRFAEIMVDEYQDSNRVQELIYSAISRGNDENRFLVGDVKQSIYGFRQAEPEIFLQKYQSFASAEAAADGQSRILVLSKNFRSRPEILEAVNHTFSSVMSPSTGGLTYGSAEFLSPGLEEYPEDGQVHVSLDVLQLKELPEGREDESTKYQREAAWVAGKIVEILQKRLPVRHGDGIRPVEPGDIAILFRSKSPMNFYQKALQKAGVPVSAVGGTELFETPEANALLSLLKTLDNPHQDVPLLAVLCCPLFRFSNDQLSRIRAVSRQPRFYDAMLECQEPWCLEALNRIRQWREKANTVSAEALVWYLLEDTGLLAAYSAMEGGAARRAHLLRIYSLSQSIAGGSYLYLYELIRALDRLSVSGMEDASANAGVTLTTIHKSKGLEYPVVFLCDLSRQFNFQELSDPVLVDADDGIGAKMTDLRHRTRYPGLCYHALKIKKRQKLLDEEMRILYVAMTRPKDYLFMTYAMGESSKVLERLLPGAGQPAEAWAVSSAGCLGDWVLLSALSRVEAGELFAATQRPACRLLVSEYPWHIGFTELELPKIPCYRAPCSEEGTTPATLPSARQIVQALHWQYPHLSATTAPSKLTATQLKGRDKDAEIAEYAATPIQLMPLLRPEFLTNQQLSPTEKGTATHLFLQYAAYDALGTEDGVIGELDRLVDQAFLTELQAQAVDPGQIITLFTSPLGQRILAAPELIREFKFSLLTDAGQFDPELAQENILLQGVVDAAIVDADGITVIDFKTDRVSEQTVMDRAEQYRGQLTTYRTALERIFHKPVKETILYFLRLGKEVIL